MYLNASPLTEPLDAIVFDCDSTLSKLEGIDVIAEQNGVGHQVHALTEKAMNTTGVNIDLYTRRMNLVCPSEQQLVDLGQAYYDACTSDAQVVVNALCGLGKMVYIVSAGLNPSVQILGKKLGIPSKNIFAVDTYFYADGAYKDYDRHSPCARKGGKREVIQQIKQTCARVLHIGDGMNDLEVKDLVTRFVGFGGVQYREVVAQKSDFYLKGPSLKALLPLALTEEELATLTV